MPLVELFHRVVGYGEARVVKKVQAYVSVVYAFVFHLIFELQIEVYSVVVQGGSGIIGFVEGRNVKVFDGASGLGGT